MDQINLPFSPGDADIAQPSFFFHLERIVQGPEMRQQALFHSHDKDHAEFQSFGLVESDQSHFIGLFFKVIHIGNQGDAFQKSAQRLCRRQFTVLFRHRAQLHDVVPAFIAIFFVENEVLITGLGNNQVEKVHQVHFLAAERSAP